MTKRILAAHPTNAASAQEAAETIGKVLSQGRARGKAPGSERKLSFSE